MSSFEFDFSAPAPSEPKRLVYTPSRLNREARALLERGFPALWVEGEISNFSRPSSGHWYFSLKDADAQLRCAMFRQKNQFLRFTPKDGMHVQIRGRVSLYEPRGDYQFIADAMEEAGEGVLRRKFELLKAKLAAEGLFAEERKRPLPRLPRRIGVITSPTGAAVRDILHVLQRRFPMIPVLIYPVPVQGATAAPQIAAAIRAASARAECDVLILARGGGSLEDLWAFNEEVVARADLRLHDSTGKRRRPRNRLHDCRPRRRCARADAIGRRRARHHARLSRMVAPVHTAGPPPGNNTGARSLRPCRSHRLAVAPPRATASGHSSSAARAALG
jgi:hypothetical protein